MFPILPGTSVWGTLSGLLWRPDLGRGANPANLQSTQRSAFGMNFVARLKDFADGTSHRWCSASTCGRQASSTTSRQEQRACCGSPMSRAEAPCTRSSRRIRLAGRVLSHLVVCGIIPELNQPCVHGSTSGIDHTAARAVVIRAGVIGCAGGWLSAVHWRRDRLVGLARPGHDRRWRSRAEHAASTHLPPTRNRNVRGGARFVADDIDLILWVRTGHHSRQRSAGLVVRNRSRRDADTPGLAAAYLIAMARASVCTWSIT